ncbi:hypothetical protein HBI56_157710 [Parastagonospora nodorum]|nr:hypothetical protein HBH53_023610 [Parastagonospora nodorum]KAH3963764.1 hypothetical protein HBH51_163440 [Parastagonospora nodorum]KAH3994617.1 hypothetical protein HBI10_184510 [Parastagonospora nodorum]KAH4014137.1 hypothetical protein HBI13_176610 [Parastagonospora nodorum]KAH4021856.1 hypothetical protein HBI09_173010 [Parastagonospora nodorum]
MPQAASEGLAFSLSVPTSLPKALVQRHQTIYPLREFVPYCTVRHIIIRPLSPQCYRPGLNKIHDTPTFFLSRSLAKMRMLVVNTNQKTTRSLL